MIAPVVQAADNHDPNLKGLYLMTDYPAVTVRPGTTSNIPLRVQNYGLTPDRYQLSVTGVPNGWTATILGGGQPVAAAMPAPDNNVSLQLRLDVPANSKLDEQTLTVKAEGQGNQASLPIQVALAKELPAKLSVTSQLPSLRGSPKSNFEYTLSIKNDSGRDVTASFCGAGAGEFRDLIHRSLRQPGAFLDPDCRGPIQRHQAEGAAAEHDRCRPFPRGGHSEG
jgi:hypothetical protein